MGIRAPATDLERTEILVPVTFRDFGLRLDPDAKQIEVGELDGAVTHAIDQMLANVFWELIPTFDLRHSITKHHAAQLVAKALGFCRVRGVAETFRQLKEFLLPALLGLDAVFYQLDEHTV